MHDPANGLPRIPLPRTPVNSVGFLKSAQGRGDYGGDLKMAAADDVDELIERFHLAQGEFVKGNTEPVKKLCSRREDVTLNNPLAPPAHGWQQVAATIERAAEKASWLAPRS
jgi:hypothetical protein